MALPGESTKKKARGVGRGRVKRARYKAEGRKTKNKVRKLTRHIAWQPNDLVASKALKALTDW
jgi:hypothetical protein